MKTFKYTSKNTIQHLSLHDCFCARMYWDCTYLIFEMEWMEVLASHPDNPFEKAHQSGIGKIVLSDAVINSAALIDGDIIRPINKGDEINDFEILKFDEKCKETGYELSMFGDSVSNPSADFIEMNITYSESGVMFDGLCDVSWFETM